MKMKCIIIDDEPVARRLLEEFIADTGFLELAEKAENPTRALELLAENNIDLIFLDINMPKLNGIDFLKNAKGLPAVIMTTAYPEFALAGFALDVLDYLVKPIPYERFLKACYKAKKMQDLKKVAEDSQQKATGYFFIKCNGVLEKVFYKDLQYAEALLNYVILHSNGRKMIVYMTIKSLVEQLPADLFLKVHKSYIVNLEKVKSIEGNTLTVGDAKISISLDLREQVLQVILKDRIIKR
jgi:DNA-binding LytR/AlgR family response regulator